MHSNCNRKVHKAISPLAADLMRRTQKFLYLAIIDFKRHSMNIVMLNLPVFLIFSNNYSFTGETLVLFVGYNPFFGEGDTSFSNYINSSKLVIFFKKVTNSCCNTKPNQYSLEKHFKLIYLRALNQKIIRLKMLSN